MTLGPDYSLAGVVALLDGARHALRTGGGLVLVHAGAGGTALLTALAQEERAVRCLSIEVPPGAAAAMRTAKAWAAAAPPPRTAAQRGLTELVIDEHGTATPPGWTPVPPPARAAPLRRGEAVVVTGGLGGLGRALAVRLHRRFGVRPVLVDLAPAEGPAPAGLGLTAPGTPYTHIAADVTDERRLERLLAPIARERPITAVVHCAGVIEGAPVRALDAAALSRLIRPKVIGLRAVLTAVDPTSLRSILAYGSILARRPHPGMGGYALANELMRRELARCAAPHRVIAEWSIWDGAGFAAEAGAVAVARRAGYIPIRREEGLDMAERLLGWSANESSVVVSARHPAEGTS